MVYSWLMDEMRYEVGIKRYFGCVLVNRRWVGYCRSLWLVDMGGRGRERRQPDKLPGIYNDPLNAARKIRAKRNHTLDGYIARHETIHAFAESEIGKHRPSQKCRARGENQVTAPH
jgi:hypothetical protein